MSLDYTVYNRLMAQEKERGRADALDLRGRAAGMDGTGIIAEERKAPLFEADRDYSGWPANSPVRDEGQVWLLLQPHNAAHYVGRPSTLRALWGLAHTTDPLKAKPYIGPYGTSGLWMQGECCMANGHVFRSLVDNGAFSPSEYGDSWEDLGPIEELSI